MSVLRLRETRSDFIIGFIFALMGLIFYPYLYSLFELSGTTYLIFTSVIFQSIILLSYHRLPKKFSPREKELGNFCMYLTQYFMLSIFFLMASVIFDSFYMQFNGIYMFILMALFNGLALSSSFRSVKYVFQVSRIIRKLASGTSTISSMEGEEE